MHFIAIQKVVSRQVKNVRTNTIKVAPPIKLSMWFVETDVYPHTSRCRRSHVCTESCTKQPAFSPMCLSSASNHKSVVLPQDTLSVSITETTTHMQNCPKLHCTRFYQNNVLCILWLISKVHAVVLLCEQDTSLQRWNLQFALVPRKARTKMQGASAVDAVRKRVGFQLQGATKQKVQRFPFRTVIQIAECLMIGQQSVVAVKDEHDSLAIRFLRSCDAPCGGQSHGIDKLLPL